MMSELMSCPFCGGESVVSEASLGFYTACNSKDDSCDAALGYGVCHDYSYGTFETREEAIRAWNTRAKPAVKVKALDWFKGVAVTKFGRYLLVEQEDGGEIYWYIMFGRSTVTTAGIHATEEAAKAAAQADYEARILAALE